MVFAPKKLNKPLSVRQIQANCIGKLVTVEGIGLRYLNNIIILPYHSFIPQSRAQHP